MKLRSNSRMKSNFDTLEAAGLVASASDDGSAAKEKMTKRVGDLNSLVTKVKKVEAYLADLHVHDKPKQLKMLSAVIPKVQELHESKLPVGAKKMVAMCLNELISLKEGVYASNAKQNRKTLALVASVKARTELEASAEAAQHRLDRIVAESSSDSDMDEFFRKAGEVIQKNATESVKLEPIKNKPYMLVRAPVVPTDGSLNIEKLPRMGFKAENLSGYPVIHNQLVLGINPKLLKEGVGALSEEKTKKLVRAEADRLQKMIEKQKKVKLQRVSESPRSYKSGIWFWLMPENELNALAKSSFGRNVKITSWGFAFN